MKIARRVSQKDFLQSMPSCNNLSPISYSCHQLRYAEKGFLAYFSSSLRFIYVLCKSWCIFHVRVCQKFVLWFVTNFDSKVGLGGPRHYKFTSCRGRKGWNLSNFGVVCFQVFLNKVAEPKLVFFRDSCVILCYSLYFPFPCECSSSLSIH